VIGQTLSHYKITAKLGEGGMGVVYLAEDLTLDRQVALKVLPPDLAGSQERFERFQREAKTLAAIDHPNIVHIYSVESATIEGDDPPIRGHDPEFFRNSGHVPRRDRVPLSSGHVPIHFLTMQLVQGKCLSEVTPENGMPAERLVDIATQLAAALSAAHERGIIHRDLKPANVMVDDEGRVKVLDFGLAKLRLADPGPDSSQLPTEAMTQQGLILGTVPYMSPEQIEGKPIDNRSDIFSAGVLLHEMASGTHPFAGNTSAATVGAILRDEPSSVSEIKPGLPDSLGTIVKRCMEKDPQHRYSSAKELHDELAILQNEMAAGTAISGSRANTLPSLFASPIAKAALTAIILLSIVLAAGRFMMNRPAPTADAPGISSLAVLPLQNMTGDPDQEFFADGMTEALTTDLSKISALKVTSRTSAMRFKGTDQPISEIARELGVDAVITGSVLREGDRVGIRAQLIDTTTEQNIWAESYERDLTSILALQSEMARAIASEIQVTLTPREETLIASPKQIDPAAYEAFLKGKFHLHRFTPQDLDRALRYFDSALEIAPDYALAHWGIGMVWGYRMQAGLVRPTEAGPKGLEAILRALKLDDELAEGHLGLALLRTWYLWEWDLAEASFRRALDINPSYAEARVFFSHYLAIQGHAPESTSQIEEALRLDPLNPFYPALYGVQLQMVGRIDTSIEVLQEAIAAAPGLGFGYLPLWGALRSQGRYDEALDAAKSAFANIGDQEAVEALDRGFAAGGYERAMLETAEIMATRAEMMYVEPSSIAALSDDGGNTLMALDWLERAYDERDPNLPYLSALSYSESLRADPRYEDLLQKLNLPRVH
jgi:serine/threonine protein kinase/tetratricopeptide (TPR) repeat protein